MAVKIIATLLILTVSLEMSSGSAIPIWEFLTRNEKMSYLYSTFAKLVSDHCKTNPDIRSIPVNHCKRDLLNYGYEKLQTFADLQLDTLDPYQRGANDLIWATIMRGHPAVAIAPVRRPQSNQSPPSIVVLSHANSNNKPPTYQKNPIFDEPERKHTYAMDMDQAYGYAPPPSSAEFLYPVQQSQSPKQPTYLSGPFVFRVRPDGTPIDEDKNKPYPRDDDLEAFQISKQHKVATISSNKQRRLASLTAQHLSAQFVPAQQQQQQQQQQLLLQQQQQQQLQQRSRRQSKVVNKSYTMVSNPFYSRRLVQV